MNNKIIKSFTQTTKKLYQTEFMAIHHLEDGTEWVCDRYRILTNCTNFNQKIIYSTPLNKSYDKEKNAQLHFEKSTVILDKAPGIACQIQINNRTRNVLKWSVGLAKIFNPKNMDCKFTLKDSLLTITIDEHFTYSIETSSTDNYEKSINLSYFADFIEMTESETITLKLNNHITMTDGVWNYLFATLR
jgi:hypothetical protein